MFMKKILSLILILLLSILSAFTVLAHPGKTDSNGGHYNRSTGEYHYHHGYPEHQHPNGECPYDFDDKTGSNSSSDNKSNDNYNYNYSAYSTTKSTYQSNSDSLSKASTKKESNMNYILLVFTFLIIALILYIIFLREKLKSTIASLSDADEKCNITNDKLRALKSEITIYENELNYHLIIKEALENTKKPKYNICGTPALVKRQKNEERFQAELQNNKKLKYHLHPTYIDIQKTIIETLGTETTYAYDYLIERCFKHIYSYSGSCLPKEDIITELQTFLTCWLKYYPELIIRIDEDSLALYVLIALIKNILSKGISETNSFGLYKYRNNNYLTSEGCALKLFMEFCYTELYFLDKITENTMNRCRWKIKTTFPDTFD